MAGNQLHMHHDSILKAAAAHAYRERKLFTDRNTVLAMDNYMHVQRDGISKVYIGLSGLIGLSGDRQNNYLLREQGFQAADNHLHVQ